MAEAGVTYPSVFVVDSHAAYPPLPPKPSPPRRGGRVAQNLLFLLVGLALCGVAIEACFIYRLSNPGPEKSGLSEKSIQGKEDIYVPPTRRSTDMKPSKPVAHLIAGPPPLHGKTIMLWDTVAEPLLHEMDYKDGKLFILKEGFYFVYSKIFFSQLNGVFGHSVSRISPRYLGPDIELLKSRGYNPKVGKMSTSNSYLGGVFHLYIGDSIFVKVTNLTQVLWQDSTENYFGAYMI